MSILRITYTVYAVVMALVQQAPRNLVGQLEIKLENLNIIIFYMTSICFFKD